MGISNNELMKIFNNILDSYSFHFYCISLPFSLSITEKIKLNKELGLDSKEIQSKIKSNRELAQVKDYYEEKLIDIEQNLIVFENIPKTKIYKILEDFIDKIYNYNKSGKFKKSNSKKLQNESYKLIKKDIKIMESYQAMIFDYTSYNDYNDDIEFSILIPELDEIYLTNLLLLEELKTKKFKILDVYRYGGTSLYSATKRPLKNFFKELQQDYSLKSLHIKQMIDIL